MAGKMAESPRKPPLALVAELLGIDPPRPLGPHGLELWDAVQAEYRISDRGGIELLAQACSALDRCEALAQEIARDGAVIRTRTGTVKAHPACRDELAARQFVCRTLERLGLNIEAIKPPGRPPKSYGPLER
jgi:Phage terminase, small subunit